LEWDQNRGNLRDNARVTFYSYEWPTEKSSPPSSVRAAVVGVNSN